MGSGQKQSFEKGLGQTHMLIIQSLPDKQGAIETHSGDVVAGSSLLGELSQDSWKTPFWNPSSSFVIIRPSPVHQPVYGRKPNLGCQLGMSTTPPTSSLATGSPVTHDHLYPPGVSTRSRIPWSLTPPMGRSTSQFGTCQPCQERPTQCVDKKSQFPKYTNYFSIKFYAKYLGVAVFTVLAY